MRESYFIPNLRRTISVLLTFLFAYTGFAQPDINNSTWNGWTDRGSSIATGVYARLGKLQDYQIYSTVFIYSNSNPVPGTSSGFVPGNRILAIGIRNNSGSTGSPSIKLDQNNNSYFPSPNGIVNGQASFGGNADQGDMVVNTSAGNPFEITIRSANPYVAANDYYLPSGGNWGGPGQPGFRGINPAAGVWKVFFDLDQMTAEFGPGGTRTILGKPTLGGFLSTITFAIGGLGGTEAVVGNISTSTPPSPVRVYSDATETILLSSHSTIQAGINAAVNGNVVRVDAGTYAESIIVNKSIALLGPNDAISPNGGGRVADAIIDLTGGSVIKIASNNIILKGFKIVNLNQQGAIQSGGDLSGTTASNNVTIEKNLFDNLTGNAIYTSGSISNWTVTDNKIQNVSSYISGGTYGSGMGFWKGASNVTITNNTVSNCSWEGIQFICYVTSASNILVQYNTISNILHSGMNIASNLNNVDVVDNAISNANTSMTPSEGGIIIQGLGTVSDAVISQNSISGSYNGIYVLTGFDLTGKDLVVNNNDLSGNANKSINNAATGTLNATCNWYGTVVAAAIAPKILGNVTYVPYLTNGTDNAPLTRGFQPVPNSCSGCPSGNVVQNTNTGEYFCSIQAAINDAQTLNGHTITVSAGTYVEDIIVGKSLTILGPNSAVNPCSGGRVAEAIVHPATNAVSYGEVFHVEASNVTISGFTIDGDNPALISGVTNPSGADLNAAEGVTVYVDNVNNLQVTNNIIKNFSYFGVTLFGASYSAPATTGHVISNNLMSNMGTYNDPQPNPSLNINKWGGGVLLYNNQYTAVTNNCMDDVRLGVQTGNFSRANPGAVAYQVIDGNSMTNVRRTGVFHNLHYGPASAYTVSNNSISGVSNVNETKWNGVSMFSLSVPSTASGNIINGTGVSQPSTGIEVWNVKNTTPASIIGGSVTGVSAGVFVNNFDGYNSDATPDGAHATIANVTINPTASGTGVRIYDNPASTHASVQATVTNCFITGGVDGVKLEEDAAGTVSGTVNNNSITGNSGYSINATGIANTVAATCNWYGSASGVVVASEMSGPITYIPYLTDGTDNAPGTEGFQPVPGSCNGADPTISFTATTTSGSIGSTSNGSPSTVQINFCVGSSFTFSGFSSLPGTKVGALENLTSSGNVLYNNGAVPAVRPQTDISPAGMAGFFSGTYGAYSLASGTVGTISQTYTPYYDVNNDGNYDAGTDILGSPVVLNYTIYALPTFSFDIGGSSVQNLNNGITDPGEFVTVSVCNGGTYTVSNLIHSTAANRYMISVTPSGGGLLFDGNAAGNGDISAAQFNGAQGIHTIALSNPSMGGSLVQVITPYFDANGSNSFDLGDCQGEPITITYTANPRPILRQTYNGVQVTANNDGVDDQGSFTICSSASDNVFLTEITDVQGITPSARVKVEQVVIKTNVTINTAADGVYPLGSIGPIPLGRTATLINPAMNGTVVIKRRAFYDTDNSNTLNAGDCAGDWVVYTITLDGEAPVLAAAPPAVTVACIGNVPAMTNLGWTDNRDGSGSVAGVDGPLVGGNCGGTITRTWNFTDACGNVAVTRTQIITVDDNTAPSFTAPADITILFTSPGVYNATVGATGDVTDEDDNCSTGLEASFSDGAGPVACGNNLIITRTWSLVDGCGNAAVNQVQTITVTDNNTNYIIYAEKDVNFDEYHFIGGDVGVTAANGKADFKKNTVLDPYRITAKNISVHLPSAVNNRTFSPATGGPNPTFFPYNGNTTGLSNINVNAGPVLNGNWKDVTIKKGVTVTVNGNNFGKFKIEEGATVTFTATVINMKELSVEKGKKNDNILTTVKFTNSAAVKVKDKVTIDDDTRINVLGPIVTFYAGDNTGGDEKFEVKGENIEVTANIIVPVGKLHVHGGNDGSRPVIMNGWYIIEKLDGHGKYVYWNNYDCVPFAPKGGVITKTEVKKPVVESMAASFKVSVYPNPSATDFRIQVKSSSDEPVSVRIVDVTGRTVKVINNAATNSYIIVGQELRQGSYFAEVLQGTNRQTLKLIKME